MSKRTYPHISGRNRLRAVPMCCICGQVAHWSVTVQVSWFRGEDEVREVCEAHKQTPANDLLASEPKTSGATT